MWPLLFLSLRHCGSSNVSGTGTELSGSCVCVSGIVIPAQSCRIRLRSALVKSSADNFIPSILFLSDMFVICKTYFVCQSQTVPAGGYNSFLTACEIKKKKKEELRRFMMFLWSCWIFFLGTISQFCQYFSHSLLHISFLDARVGVRSASWRGCSCGDL